MTRKPGVCRIQLSRYVNINTWGYVMQKTRNVKFVAYLRFIKIHPDNVEKFARGKANYSFEIDDEKWQGLKSDFDRSDFITYAQCLDAVTDLAY